MTNTKFMIIFILVQKLVSLIFQSLNYTVIKPGPARRVDPVSGRFGFVKRPANAITRQNPVDLAGQPMTPANPDETRCFVSLFKYGFSPIPVFYIYIF